MIFYKYLPLTWSDDLTKTEMTLQLSRLDCIKSDSFWFSKPATLNDPYDCRPSFKNIADIAELREILSQLTEEELNFILARYPRCRTREDILNLHQSIYDSTQSDAIKVMNFVFQMFAYSIIKTKLKNIGVLSLSRTHRNIQMWAHYAQNHKGLCIEIEIPRTTKGLRRVVYTKIQPYLSLHEAMNEQYGKLVDLFYTKSNAWCHEREWRIVTIKGNDIRDIKDGHIKKIIYGLNTTDITKQKIKEAVGSHIETYQIRQKRNYALE
jgi:hypothetical protein